MDLNWTLAAPTVLAAFFASLVEFIEALTIVLAVGAVRGWRGAIGGAALALVVPLLLRSSCAGRPSLRFQKAMFSSFSTLLLLFGFERRLSRCRTSSGAPMPREGPYGERYEGNIMNVLRTILNELTAFS
jgi:uncharacterized membrane protein